jgi:hypothetical protein
MNNVVIRKVIVSASYQPLVVSSPPGGKFVASVTISCPPTNTASVLFRGDDGSDVPWLPGEWHEFRSIDLSELQIKGNAGDSVTVIGGTW